MSCCVGCVLSSLCPSTPNHDMIYLPIQCLTLDMKGSHFYAHHHIFLEPSRATMQGALAVYSRETTSIGNLSPVACPLSPLSCSLPFLYSCRRDVDTRIHKTENHLSPRQFLDRFAGSAARLEGVKRHVATGETRPPFSPLLPFPSYRIRPGTCRGVEERQLRD